MAVWEMSKKAIDGSTIIRKRKDDGENIILGWSWLTELENIRSFVLHLDDYDWVLTKDGPFILLPETGERNN